MWIDNRTDEGGSPTWTFTRWAIRPWLPRSPVANGGRPLKPFQRSDDTRHQGGIYQGLDAQERMPGGSGHRPSTPSRLNGDSIMAMATWQPVSWTCSTLETVQWTMPLAAPFRCVARRIPWPAVPTYGAATATGGRAGQELQPDRNQARIRPAVLLLWNAPEDPTGDALDGATPSPDQG